MTTYSYGRGATERTNKVVSASELSWRKQSTDKTANTEGHRGDAEDD